MEHSKWNMHIRSIYLFISFSVASRVQGQLPDSYSADEVTLVDMGKIDRCETRT